MRFFLLFFCLFHAAAFANPLAGVQQLIVSVAPDWNSYQGELRLFERRGSQWQAASPVYPVIYGKNGLAWGRGVLGQEQEGLHKKERDKRAPAGLFALGKIYTYDPALPKGANYPFVTVGPNDAWLDDPTLPLYNQYVRVDPQNRPEWFEKQKMRHNDFAYRWLVEIRHNSGKPVPGAGSAIFFHIRRGPDRPSAGCTVMAEGDLISMMRWLRADARPHYVLLPQAEYAKKWRDWGLPSPEQLR
ncbi:MAG TPA: L,D-transpeptidase family protein [Chthoniobacterales bacterium]|jgi:L,D-peptidoglycan transpeptidase YkuD (ErfK/YbiS/YcfS/YnhG family)